MERNTRTLYLSDYNSPDNNKCLFSPDRVDLELRKFEISNNSIQLRNFNNCEIGGTAVLATDYYLYLYYLSSHLHVVELENNHSSLPA